MAPGTVWRHALRRVDRRIHADPTLLAQAVRLANRLAYVAGIAGPLAHRKELPR